MQARRVKCPPLASHPQHQQHGQRQRQQQQQQQQQGDSARSNSQCRCSRAAVQPCSRLAPHRTAHTRNNARHSDGPPSDSPPHASQARSHCSGLGAGRWPHAAWSWSLPARGLRRVCQAQSRWPHAASCAPWPALVACRLSLVLKCDDPPTPPSHRTSHSP